MKNKWIAPAIAFAFILVWTSTYSVKEGRQAIITQFGKPIRTVQSSGLHWKLPLIHKVRMIDLRILNWDGYPNQIPTKDKKYISVDTTARWKIVDPLKFIQTVQSEAGARSRLDAILDGVTRDVISSHNLVEAVRDSNKILDEINAEAKKKEESTEEEEVGSVEEEIIGEIDPVEVGREKISQLIIEPAKEELNALGIELIDVQLRRIAYQDSVQQKVYSRMISERQRIAEKIRSIGKGEQARIRGKTQRDLKKIQSDAYRKIQTIKGKAEATATKVYADSLGKDPKFYSFIRQLDAYDKGINQDMNFLFSSDSKFWDLIQSGKVRQ